jgi:hypothetical protein
MANDLDEKSDIVPELFRDKYSRMQQFDEDSDEAAIVELVVFGDIRRWSSIAWRVCSVSTAISPTVSGNIFHRMVTSATLLTHFGQGWRELVAARTTIESWPTTERVN